MLPWAARNSPPYIAAHNSIADVGSDNSGVCGRGRGPAHQHAPLCPVGGHAVPSWEPLPWGTYGMALGTTGIQLPSPITSRKAEGLWLCPDGEAWPSSMPHKDDWALLISSVVWWLLGFFLWSLKGPRSQAHQPLAESSAAGAESPADYAGIEPGLHKQTTQVPCHWVAAQPAYLTCFFTISFLFITVCTEVEPGWRASFSER